MTLKLVDVHCHLMHELFAKDLPEVIARAEKAGVKVMLVSGTTPEANIAALELAKKYLSIKASLGIYPIDALGLAPDADGMPRHVGLIDIEEQFRFIKKNLAHITAIGEIGMDFYWAKKEDTYDKQADNFRKIIRFAKEIKKPIVIHSRKAEEECIAILREEISNKEIAIVQHCFSGRKSLMSEAISLGHYFSIPPNILRADNFKTLVKKVSIEQLLTETDAPWLSPFPEKRNEPAFVMETIKIIAEIKEISIEEAAAKIWKNYERVFQTI